MQIELDFQNSSYLVYKRKNILQKYQTRKCVIDLMLRKSRLYSSQLNIFTAGAICLATVDVNVGDFTKEGSSKKSIAASILIPHEK